ncbi:LysR family transcriptional regulator [Vibrio sp. TRT 21S02]|uniref:LysR family transcriptional regulator n=1 Tax=unclassified Vibrio TaxID=2614977 RepID=UPI00349F3379
MFNLEQLEAFVVTVETGSFSAAARQLGKVQSAISQHVINLEIDCGFELFDRQGRYPKLTHQGEHLLPFAQATLAQHQRFCNSVTMLEENGHHQISIAIDEGLPLNNLAKVVDSFCQHYPNVELEFLTASSSDVIEMVESKRVSTGLIFSELHLPQGIDFESIGSVEFDVYVGIHHPLAAVKTQHIDQLRLHRQLLLRSKNGKTSSFMTPLSPDVWHADNYYVLLELVSAGIGWTLLPVHIALPMLESGQLIRLPIQFEQLSWLANVDVIQHQTSSSSVINTALRSQLRELLK